MSPALGNLYENYIVDFFVGGKEEQKVVEKGGKDSAKVSKERGEGRKEGEGEDEHVRKEEERSKGEVRVVELNSFESWTGACLFSWNLDREVLLREGREKEEEKGDEGGDVEMRMVETPPQVDIKDFIPPAWLAVVLEELAEFIEEEKEVTEDGRGRGRGEGGGGEGDGPEDSRGLFDKCTIG